MKLSLAALALPIAAHAALYSSAEYRSGAVHAELMKLKNVRTDRSVQDILSCTNGLTGPMGSR